MQKESENLSPLDMKLKNYELVSDRVTMQTEFKNLAWKCAENGVRFEYIPYTDNVIVSYENKLIGMSRLDNMAEQELRLLSMKIDWYMDGVTDLTGITVNRSYRYAE